MVSTYTSVLKFGFTVLLDGFVISILGITQGVEFGDRVDGSWDSVGELGGIRSECRGLGGSESRSRGNEEGSDGGRELHSEIEIGLWRFGAESLSCRTNLIFMTVARSKRYQRIPFSKLLMDAEPGLMSKRALACCKNVTYPRISFATTKRVQEI